MDIVKRVIKNTVALSSVRIINPAVTFLLVMLIARYRNVAFMGDYSLVCALSSVFAMIACLGLEILIMRDVPKNEEDAGRYAINGFAILFCSGILFAVMMSVTANILDYDEDVIIAIYVAALALVPSCLCVVCRGIIKAFEKNTYIAFVSFTESVLRVGVSIAVLQMGFGLTALMTVSLGTSLVGLLFLFSFVRTRIISSLKYSVDWRFCRRILKSTVTFAIIGIVVSLYMRIGIIILSEINGAFAVGVFSCGFKVLTLAQGFITAFGMSLFPNISRRYEMKTGDFERISINAARYIVILMLYMAIIITFLSEHIIEFLFGSKFTESAGVLKILIWATVPYSMVTVFAYSLFSSFNQRVDLAINGIGLASNVLLNILLIPRFSYLGTSFAVVVSACILLICQWIFINRNLFPLKMTRILLRPLLGAAIMVSFIVLLRSKVNIYLLLFGATFPYGCSLYLLGAFDGSEMAYLRQVTSRLFHFRKVPLLR